MTAPRIAKGVRVLVYDPDPAVRRMMRAALARREVLNVMEADCMESAFAFAGHCDAALVAVGPAEAVVALSRLRAAGLSGVLIAALDHGSVTGAVAAMRAGADDVVLKPIRAEEVVDRLLKAVPIERVERRRPSRGDAAAASSALGGDFCGFLGRSAPMLALYERIRRVASSRAPVFVTGESGTGKELAAAAVHARSSRSGGPFLALNCGALPRELMESEMFGHARGAFTGAHADRAGAAELADGGTLFLDEIGEMDLALQAKLLRFLQDGNVRRVGEGHERQVGVRIVCATNRDPLAEVKAGRLREDLFYRLHVLHLHLPPLRERGDDVILLSETFLARFAGEEARPLPRIGPEAREALRRRRWRGNVRELQNLMRRTVVLGDGTNLTPHFLEEDAPPAGGGTASLPCEMGAAGAISPRSGGVRAGIRLVEPFAVVERRAIEEAIAAFDGNISLAAAALDLSPSTLYRKKLSWRDGIQVA